MDEIHPIRTSFSLGTDEFSVEGVEIMVTESASNVRALSENDEVRDALFYVAGILKKRDYSEAELRARLEARGYSPDRIGETIQILHRHRFIQEDSVIEKEMQHARGLHARGDSLIRHRLALRGISEEKISQALSDEEMPNEISRACELIRMKFPRALTISKVARTLQSRGFSEDTITEVISNIDSSQGPLDRIDSPDAEFSE